MEREKAAEKNKKKKQEVKTKSTDRILFIYSVTFGTLFVVLQLDLLFSCFFAEPLLFFSHLHSQSTISVYVCVCVSVSAFGAGSFLQFI